MIQYIPVRQIAEEVRDLYRADPLRAEASIEEYLERTTAGFSGDERLAFLERIEEQFRPAAPCEQPPVESVLISKLFSMILGKKILKEEIASKELLEKLAKSLNTVFDTLNELIEIIQSTFMGGCGDHQTIRHFIGSQLEDAGSAFSLESYINQIREAFLTTHTAFKGAARAQMSKVLDELNPEAIEKESGGGLSFGPFRKAESFDVYRVKYGNVRQWFDSGRNMEELLREFEKICQEIYAEKRGTT